jgi:hypothetical protein
VPDENPEETPEPENPPVAENPEIPVDEGFPADGELYDGAENQDSCPFCGISGGCGHRSGG